MEVVVDMSMSRFLGHNLVQHLHQQSLSSILVLFLQQILQEMLQVVELPQKVLIGNF